MSESNANSRRSLSHQPRFYSDFVRRSLDHHDSSQKNTTRHAKESKLKRLFCPCFTRKQSNSSDLANITEQNEVESLQNN